MVDALGDMLGDAGGELFDFNRESYFFDMELRIERKFQEQDMRVQESNMYREDIRDLMGLVVGKMDSYLIVIILELGCCLDILFHGVLNREGESPMEPWFVWVYVVSLAEAFLFLFLSAWLSIHASVTCHSLAVRLLTQYVRLAIPTEEQIAAASAVGQDFERRADEFFHVPLWSRFTSQIQTLTRDHEGPQSRLEGAAAAPAEPAAIWQLNHIRKYEELQPHWQAHDGYARACLALGTYQFLHALAYYAIGMLTVEMGTAVPALGFAIVVITLSCSIMRLDPRALAGGPPGPPGPAASVSPLRAAA